MAGLKPWTGMAGLRQEMDQMFERLLEPMWREMPAMGDWRPAAAHGPGATVRLLHVAPVPECVVDADGRTIAYATLRQRAACGRLSCDVR